MENSIIRKLLQEADTIDGISDTTLSPTAPIKKLFNPTTETRAPFDSSMALTILVLLTALFFMGFFSVYIRRFAAAASSTHSPTPTATRSRPSSYRKQSTGLDPTAINSLPLVGYGRDEKHRMIIEDCPICLSEFQEKENVKVIPYCGHVFHPKCVDTWLLSNVTCPLCRSAQLFERVEEEVCLDVARDESESCGCEGSTVLDVDTWRERGLGGVRRVCSCTNVANHSVLQRSTSF